MYCGCLGGYLSGINGNWRHLDVFVGYLGSQSLQYRVKALFWHSPERHGLFSSDSTETSKYQDVYMEVHAR